MHTRACCHRAGRLRAVLIRWGVSCALALGCAALAASTAHADPLAGIDVRWSGPASCPDHGEVATEARRLLPLDGAYEATQIEIAVQELPAPRTGYRLQLAATSASRTAERTLELATCKEAREAAGLLVALTLDPEAVAAAEAVLEPPPSAAPSEAPTVPEQKPEPPPSPPPAETATPKPEPPPSPAEDDPTPEPEPEERGAALELGPELTAGALLDSSALPAVALGPFAALGFRIGTVRLSLGGFYLPGAERSAAGDGSIRATLIAGQLGLCALWPVGSALELGPCASGELGRYAARARGVTHGESDATLWAAGSAGAGAALQLTRRLALLGSVALIVPFRRPELGLQTMENAYVVPPLSLRAALGVRWF